MNSLKEFYMDCPIRDNKFTRLLANGNFDSKFLWKQSLITNKKIGKQIKNLA